MKLCTGFSGTYSFSELFFSPMTFVSLYINGTTTTRLSFVIAASSLAHCFGYLLITISWYIFKVCFFTLMFIWIKTILSAAYLRASFYSVVFIVAVAKFEQAVSSLCQHIIINVLWKAWSGRCIPDLWIEMNWDNSSHLSETTIIHLKWVSYFCCCTQTARNCLIVLYLIELLCLKIMLDFNLFYFNFTLIYNNQVIMNGWFPSYWWILMPITMISPR